MANKKRRCTSCKKYKETEKGIVAPIGFFCDKQCQYDYATKKPKDLKKKTDIIVKKKHAKEKRSFQLSDRKTRKTALKTACHAYIRARDKDKLCICCNEPLGKDYHAGHWLESGNNPLIRYDEDNIHGQRVYCNKFKGGDSGDYQKNLRIKIGDNKVDRLLGMKGGVDPLSADDMLELENKYKQKLKDLIQ